MKIYRSGRTSSRWKKTDARSMKALVSGWSPGTVFPVDGTIEKTGKRHTDFGIEVESRDIVALHKALLQYQTNTLSSLRKENEALKETVDILEKVLRKIDALTSYRRDQAPNLEALTDMVAYIADHFSSSYSRKQPLKINARWVKWKSI